MLELVKVVNVLLCLWLAKLLAKSDKAVDHATISQCLTYCLMMGSIFIFNLVYKYSGWKSRNAYCYFLAFAQSFGYFYSFIIIIAIAILRYLYCIHPFFMRNRRPRTLTMYIVTVSISLTFANTIYLMVFPQRVLIQCLGMQNYREKYRVPFLQFFIIIALYCYCRIAYNRFCKTNVSTRENRCMVSVAGSSLNLLAMLLVLVGRRALVYKSCNIYGDLLPITVTCGFTQVMYILTSYEVRRDAWNDLKNIIACIFSSFQRALISRLFARNNLSHVINRVRQQNTVDPETRVNPPSHLPMTREQLPDREHDLHRTNITLVSETYCREMRATKRSSRHSAMPKHFLEVAELHYTNVNVGPDVYHARCKTSSQGIGSFHRMIKSDENLYPKSDCENIIRDEMKIYQSIADSAAGIFNSHYKVFNVSDKITVSAAFDNTLKMAPRSCYQMIHAFGQRRHSFPSLASTRPCHSPLANPR